jgi:uncharacterized membrane protein
MSVRALERPPRSARPAPRHAAAPRRRGFGACLGAMVLVALLVPLHRLWAVQVLLVPLLLTAPGVILLRALRIPGEVVSSFPVYVPCASIVVLLGSGLVVDLSGPLVGVAAPIRAAPLLLGLEITCLTLLAASFNAEPNVEIPLRSLSRPARLAWPMILPLVSAAGALRLNSGHGDGVAVIGLSACVVVVIAALIFSSWLDEPLLAVILYAAELATMWSFSLRGNLVYGFDIASEYYDLHQTVLTGVWHTAHPTDAYGAMLSVTVMPAELHFLSGVPDLLVFKVAYPAISALLPVAVFGLARRILSRRWAFAAAAFIVMQATFTQEFPAIARQEIALVLFAAVAMAMLDSRVPRRPQWALVAALAFAMALSHYSTTYLAIILFALMIALQWAASWLREMLRVTGAVAVALLASVAGAVIWYGPLTHSTASGLQQLAQSVESQGFNVLPNHAPGGGALTAYLQGNAPTPMTATQYERRIPTEMVQVAPFIKPLDDASRRIYALRNAAPPKPPVKWRAGYSALSLGSLIFQQLMYVLGAIGALLMVLRRKASVVARQVGLLALATLFFLAVIRLSGTLAAAYNQERALLQATVVLAIAFCWSLQELSGRREGRQAGVLAVAAACLTVMFTSTSGLTGAVFGGGTATNLANSGEDYERFYMTAPELASARWLGKAVRPGQLVYADRYAQLPLVAMTGITRGLFNAVTPATIDQHAWVYASRSNVIGKRARAFYKGHTVTYVFPAAFLDANFDLVYTDGSSEVFHR